LDFDSGFDWEMDYFHELQPTTFKHKGYTFFKSEQQTGDVCTMGTMTAGGIGDRSALLDTKYFKFDDQTAYDDFTSAGYQFWHNDLGRTTYVSQTSSWPEGCMKACCANQACQSFGFYKSECYLYSVATSAGMDDILEHDSRQGPWGINTGGPGYSIGFWEMSRKPRFACANVAGTWWYHSAVAEYLQPMTIVQDGCAGVISGFPDSVGQTEVQFLSDEVQDAQNGVSYRLRFDLGSGYDDDEMGSLYDREPMIFEYQGFTFRKSIRQPETIFTYSADGNSNHVIGLVGTETFEEILEKIGKPLGLTFDKVRGSDLLEEFWKHNEKHNGHH